MKWFVHIERMESVEFMKPEVYESELKGPNRRGRPLGRGKERVVEYLGELLMEGECLNNQGGSLGIGRGGDFCHGHPLEEHCRRERGITAIDREKGTQRLYSKAQFTKLIGSKMGNVN